MKKDIIISRLTVWLEKMKELGAHTRELIVRPPATEEEIQVAEQQLAYTLPSEFREALLNISSHLEFYWNIYDKDKEIVALPKELVEIFSGQLHFGIDLIPVFEESRKSWIDICYPDYNDPYDKIYYNKLAFQEVGNGDYFAIDLEEASYGKIVYLSHDGSDLHGYVIANSFTEFLEEYTKLGCVGAEDWQWEAFTNQHTTPIDSNCDNAKLWFSTIGVSVE
ncbi:SMI1/KNR4 family protein [Tannerella forsythia]|uniref:SMI1/KNR4 family protein n=1 Tax=Tannerella forsythia TaxID=28112 RepID=A0A3P1XRS2_TANFO|nr:SMI1/KNR4 family protein [Tannerella forsythia]RRD60750.1 SMI1/KNR4 family protein [Tannerella forsythia]